MSFRTDLTYTTRIEKALYVWTKYQKILSEGAILDVGADECHLKKHLPEGVAYTGVDFGGHEEVISVDLDHEDLPFEDESFDTVLCLDVLEHLDSFHDVFDRLCRVTREWLILSLPNPYGSLMQELISNGHSKGGRLQHYGLPVEKPMDRHRWFFSASDAQSFMKERALQNGMSVVDFDQYDARLGTDGSLSFFDRLAKRKQHVLMNLLFPSSFKEDFDPLTLWWVLERTDSGTGKS